jgi:hypothetical protein
MDGRVCHVCFLRFGFCYTRNYSSGDGEAVHASPNWRKQRIAAAGIARPWLLETQCIRRRHRSFPPVHGSTLQPHSLACQLSLSFTLTQHYPDRLSTRFLTSYRASPAAIDSGSPHLLRTPPASLAHTRHDPSGAPAQPASTLRLSSAGASV